MSQPAARPKARKATPRKLAVRKAVPRKKPAPRMEDYLNKPPKGWVDLKTFIPGIKLSIRYHTADNFTGAPLAGYGAPGAWMRRKAALGLKKVQAWLNKRGYGLIVYDAYRPYRGTLAMVAWTYRTRQTHLLKQGYIATRSGHNRGHTVDLSMVTLKSGKLVDMGTPWDTLSKKSHTRNARGQIRKNRMLLVRAMRVGGFRNYWKEWWHFSFRMKARPRNVPYGCYEPSEKDWRPPKGWRRPGYKPAMKWNPRPCR